MADKVDTKVYAALSPRTNDVEFYYHICPVCNTTHNHGPATDQATLEGHRTFRCYFGVCKTRGTVLRIVGGFAVEEPTETTPHPFIDCERPTEGYSESLEDKTLIYELENVVAREMKIRSRPMFGHTEGDPERAKPAPPEEKKDDGGYGYGGGFGFGFGGGM
jgi:hypothetical protein